MKKLLSSLTMLTMVLSSSAVFPLTAGAVANVPPPACDLIDVSHTIISDTTTQENGHDSVVVSPINPGWTASIDSGATWIWGETLSNTDAVAGSSEDFSKSFTITGVPLDSTLDIAADNTYTVSVNGHLINTDNNADNFSAAGQDSVVIPAADLLSGSNTITFTVTNLPLADSTALSNPAGLLYKLVTHENDCTPPPVDVCPNINGVQTIVPDGYQINSDKNCVPIPPPVCNADQQLVTNGSFEDGVDPGTFATLNSGDTSINNWTVDSGSVDYIGTYWQSSDGSKSIDLNGLTAGSISQTFTTIVGQTYTVTFDLSGNPDSSTDQNFASPSLKDVKVSATGASSTDFTYDTAVSGNSLIDMKWEHKSYSFIATSVSTTLTFASQIAGAFGPALDNISIKCSPDVPPPPVCDAKTELVQNGSFEAPVVDSGQWNIFPSGTPGLAWTVDWFGGSTSFNSVTRPNVANAELQSNGLGGWNASNGVQWTELDSDWDGPNGSLTGEPASVAISQDIPTTVGQTYKMTFDFAGRPGLTDSSQNILEVLHGGMLDTTLSDTNFSATPDWTPESVTFTATTSTTHITFRDAGTPDSVGTFLDNVSMRCVPPPVDQKATLHIIKHTVGGDGSFNFNIENSTHFSAGFQTQTQNGISDENISTPDAGDYTITEDGQDGWTLTGASCIANNQEVGSFTDNIEHLTLTPGEDVTCTFTNTKNHEPTSGHIHIFKFVDGVQATTESAGGVSFPMITPTYGDAPFTLGPNGWNPAIPDQPYEASTSEIPAGRPYTAHEDLTTKLVGESCNSDSKPIYELVGYSSGATLVDAENATKTLTPPNFTVDGDAYFIVWNHVCGDVLGSHTLKVHIFKYFGNSDGSTQVPDDSTAPAFPMTATWQTANLNGGVSTSGDYVLGDNHGGAVLKYSADTSPMEAPADYTTSEVTDGSVVVPNNSDSCPEGKYRLIGYKSSLTSLSGAQSASISLTAPNFTALDADAYVIVVNTPCPPPTPTGTIKLTKYECPAGTVINRTDNGPSATDINATHFTVPQGCEPEPNATFGYTYDAGNSGNSTGPYLGLFGDITPFTPFALTDGAGMTSLLNAATPGRYIVVELDKDGKQLPKEDMLGLYCYGDGDPTPTDNDNQEITFSVANKVSNCVAYNKMAHVTVIKDTIGGDGTFHFTGLNGQKEGFDLTTTVQNNHQASSFFDVFADGNGTDYTVSEDVTSGWNFSGSDCVYDNQSVGTPTQPPGGEHINVHPGDNLVCTFTNTKQTSDSISDLSVTKSVDHETAHIGDTIVYTITAHNAGPNDATDVVVHDLLPAGVTYVSNDSSNSGTLYNSTTGTWTIGTFENASTTTLHITATVTSGDTDGQHIVNTATVSGDNNDSNTENNSGSVSFTVNNPESTVTTFSISNGVGGGGGNGPVNFGAVNGGGGGGGLVLGASTTGGDQGQVLGASCGLYMDKHIRLGSSKNDSDQVKKLQAFLNKWLHTHLPITGFYGNLTLAELKAFQAKYGDDILKPWNLTSPTGLVYLATLTKINNLECPDLSIQLPPLIPWSQNPNAQ